MNTLSIGYDAFDKYSYDDSPLLHFDLWMKFRKAAVMINNDYLAVKLRFCF